MKKTDLYRSIDSVKPDKELKSNILKAVGENDKITVIKRPLFIPIMVGILVCINIGMAAKLVIFNKSQINMSDFEAKASLSSASGKSESIIQGKSDENDEVSEQSVSESRTFQSCLEILKKDIDDDKLVSVQKCKMSGPEEIPKEPYYMTNEWSEDITEDITEDNGNSEEDIPEYDENSETDEYTLMRYVEEIAFNDKYMLTNHEYIVVYKGGCVPENIVSITESNVDISDISNAELEQKFKKLNENDIVSQSIEETANEIMSAVDPENSYEIRNFGVVSNILMYPAVNGSGNTAEDVLCCYYSLSNYDDQFDEREYSVYDTFFLNDNGEIISYKFNSGEDEKKYWKDTLYRPEKVKVPNIIGMDLNDARKALENAGLRLGTQDYGCVPRGTDFQLNQVMECTNYKAGELVDSGTSIDISLCPNAVPFINGLPLEVAEDMLKRQGLSYGVEYFNYENKSVLNNEDDRYVLSCYPNEGMPIEESGLVRLVIASYKKGIAEELVGSVISMASEKRVIYYGEEAKKKITEAEYSHDFEGDLCKIFLDTAYSGIYAYGTYYSNECFRVERIVSESEFIYASSRLRCGMVCENGFSEYINEEDIYGQDFSINTVSYEDYNYIISYKDNKGKWVYVYIKAVSENDSTSKEIIEKICVSNKILN